MLHPQQQWAMGKQVGRALLHSTVRRLGFVLAERTGELRHRIGVRSCQINNLVLQPVRALESRRNHNKGIHTSLLQALYKNVSFPSLPSEELSLAA